MKIKESELRLLKTIIEKEIDKYTNLKNKNDELGYVELIKIHTKIIDTLES